MLSSSKDCLFGLVFSVLGFVPLAWHGPASAQTAEPPSGGFSDRFSGQDRSLPTFARPGATPSFVAPAEAAEGTKPPVQEGTAEGTKPTVQEGTASTKPAKTPPDREPGTAGAKRTATKSVPGKRPIATGRAVFYEHPGRTASGETYNPDGHTAAHRTLPFGTRLRVVNQHNGRSVIVRINDRGPPKPNVIDLSRGSARAIGITSVGTVALYKLD
jgi:peptidoglycan lytic transglycosylase